MTGMVVLVPARDKERSRHRRARAQEATLACSCPFASTTTATGGGQVAPQARGCSCCICKRCTRRPVPAGSTSRRACEPLGTHAVTQMARVQPLANLRWALLCAQPQRRPAPRGHAQTLTLSPSAGPMQIALKPRLSHQSTPIPTQHVISSSLPHKSAARHAKYPVFPDPRYTSLRHPTNTQTPWSTWLRH
jgi:hypothetical protein